MDEIASAVAVVRRAGGRSLALLHCVSAYPVPTGAENLKAIDILGRAFGVPVGLSDHGADTFAVPMAIALGASLYERHLVLEDDDVAIDRAVSSTPLELAAAIAAARRAYRALGDGRKTGHGADRLNRVASRRSLCAARALPAGHVLTASDLIALRPETGLAPSELLRVLGATLKRAMDRGEALQTHDLIPVAARRPRAS
jgi:sialic acid synthase SpsE